MVVAIALNSRRLRREANITLATPRAWYMVEKVFLVDLCGFAAALGRENVWVGGNC